MTVWAGGGAGGAFLGELIAARLAEKGCSGALVEGAVRDVRWLRQMGFTAYSTEVSPVQSSGHCRIVAYQEPLQLPAAGGGLVKVEPGDFVLGDDDGVVVVPGDRVVEVLVEVEHLTERESAIREAMAGGLTLAESAARFGKL